MFSDGRNQGGGGNLEILKFLTLKSSQGSKYLKKIDYALSQFEDDSYGVCELTGENIPVERLLARPVALYTVEAQAEIERKEKGFRDPDDVEDNEMFSEDFSD